MTITLLNVFIFVYSSKRSNKLMKSTFFSLIALLSIHTSLAKPLVVCTEASPEGFDIVRYNSSATTNAAADTLFNRLIEYQPLTHKFIPSLAARWEVSQDNRTYTFYLRKDVVFHRNELFIPSRLLNADDVVFSFKRMLDLQNPWYKHTPTGFPYAQSYQLNTLIQSIEKLDTYTVRFTLSKPDATFISLLSMGFASIYSAEYAQLLLKMGKTEHINHKPIGTGPFILRRYHKDAVIRFDANPAYFSGKPKTDQLIYAITPDAALRVQKLKAGECHIALSPKPQDIRAVKNNKNIRTLSAPASMTAYIAINTQHKPLNHKALRQALNMTLNKETYLKVVFEGNGIIAKGPLPPTIWGHSTTTDYAYDPVQAKKILAEAGFPQGFETTIWTRTSNGISNPNPKAGAELLQADLAKIGVIAKINVLEWGELLQRSKMGAHDLLFMGWISDSDDPDNFFSPLFRCSAANAGTNFARYCNYQLDKLITAGTTTTDLKARSQIYQNVQKIIHDEALWIPLVHPMLTVLIRNNVNGYTVNPFGRQDFAQTVVQ